MDLDLFLFIQTNIMRFNNILYIELTMKIAIWQPKKGSNDKVLEVIISKLWSIK